MRTEGMERNSTLVSQKMNYSKFKKEKTNKKSQQIGL